MFRLGEKKVLGTELNNRIIWILLAWFIHFFIIGAVLFSALFGAVFSRFFSYDNVSDSVGFVISTYLASFFFFFIYVFLYTYLVKKNRFIFRSFLPKERGNKVSKLLRGLLAGFLTNTFCVIVAVLCGDLKLSLDFSLSDIPFYLFALVCVLIQSGTEELWNRGFLMERIHVHYPLWVAMLLNSLVFGALHLGNPGISVLPVINLIVVGVAFSVLSWQTDSIWYPIGAHTAWNFTQNLIFGLPNSGLVSEVSIFHLEAANANDPLIYDVQFGVEGSLPATIINIALMALFLFYAYKEGRLGELLQSKESGQKLAQPMEELEEGETEC